MSFLLLSRLDEEIEPLVGIFFVESRDYSFFFCKSISFLMFYSLEDSFFSLVGYFFELYSPNINSFFSLLFSLILSFSLEVFFKVLIS